MHTTQSRYKRFVTSEELSDILPYLRSMMRKIFITTFLHKYPAAWLKAKMESEKVFEGRRRKVEDEEEAEEKALLK